MKNGVLFPIEWEAIRNRPLWHTYFTYFLHNRPYCHFFYQKWKEIWIGTNFPGSRVKIKS
jgi:hypothetical protein